MQPLKVFVYGTLKKGYGNHHVLGGSLFLGEAVTEETYTLTDCGFPYMVPDSDGKPVSGEVYLVDDPAVLLGLDALEGVSYGHYKHHTANVFLGEDEIVKAVSYIPCKKEFALKYPICDTNSNGEYVWKR